MTNRTMRFLMESIAVGIIVGCALGAIAFYMVGHPANLTAPSPVVRQQN